MRQYKNIAFLLLIVFFVGVATPSPVYAASWGDSGKSIIETLAGLFLGDFLTNILHIKLPGIPSKSLPVPSNNDGGKDVLGFYAEWWGDDTSSYDDLVKNTDAIGTIATFWGTLNADGSLSDRGGNDHASVVKYAHNHKITTLLMVNNLKQSEPGAGIHELLANPSSRKTAIDNLERYIKKYSLDGINIDFEMVPASDRDNLTAFMQELSARLKPQGYIVTIDVFPKHNEDNDVAAAYDYAKLAQYADKIILMTYDYHGAWSEPGSIADILLIETDVKYALTQIPKNKIYMGIAGYGYDWSSKGVESLEYSAIQNLINRFGPIVQWDDAAKSPHFSYTGSDGVVHQVWYENSQSLKYKLDLVNRYDLAGIAIWKLGEEDPASWKVIKDTLKR